MKNYTKISKAKARKLFNEGKEIYLHTSKLSWNNMWQNPMPVTIDRYQEQADIEFNNFCINLDKQYPNLPAKEHKIIPQFEQIVNSYSLYNCDKERGLRVIYLIETK